MDDRQALSYLNPTEIHGILQDLWQQPALKFLTGAALTIAQWLFGAHFDMLMVVSALVFLDTTTGVWKAARKNQVCSRSFFRVAAKTLVYFILLATGALVDKALPGELPVAITVMWSFLALTEALSILENISVLGFPVPIRFVRMLRDYQTAQKLRPVVRRRRARKRK